MKLRTRIIIVGAWLLLAVPMIFWGYGEADSWLSAAAAAKIWETGKYVRSRSVGFPLFELIVAPLVHFGGWYLSNILSLISGIAIILALFHLSNKDKLTHPILVILSITFLPYFLVASTSTMDYIPALAFLIWAYVGVTEQKYWMSAALVGIACGFRLTSGFYIIPCMVYCYKRTKSFSSALIMGLIGTFVGILAFSPALFKYGISNPYYPLMDQMDFLTKLLRIIYNFVLLFGIWQTLLLAIILVYLIIHINKINHNYLNSPELLFHSTVIVLWIFIFLLMPHKPEYLIPAVPSLFLLLDKLAGRKIFVFLTLSLLFYHFISLELKGGESGARSVSPSIQYGYTIREINNRIFQLSLREIATKHNTDRRTVLMLGVVYIAGVNNKWVCVDPKYEIYRQREGNLFVSGRILDELKLKELSDAGFRLVVWNKEKWEYFRIKDNAWKKYVEVIYDLDKFFGVHVSGKAITDVN